MFILSASENILLFVAGFGWLQGISSAALLFFHPKSDRSVNRFLALYLLVLTLPIGLPLVQNLFSWQVITFIEPFITLSPPFLYLYVRSFKETISWKKAWPHFILFFVCVGLALWVYHDIGSKYPLSPVFPEEAKKNMLLLLPFTVRLVQRVAYYFLARRALNFYQRSIVHLFSETNSISLNWINWLINGFLFLIFLSIAVFFIMTRYPQYFDWSILVCAVIVALYVYMATFKGVTQPTLWNLHPEVDKNKLESEINSAGNIVLSQPEPIKSSSAARSRKDESKLGEIVVRVQEAMEKDKLYEQPDLTLQNLSDQLRLPSYQLSQAINQGLQKTFYDLVNGYRVEAAKRLLLDVKNKNFTILSVGFDAGFNSKTTFNTVFKKFTGLTPTEFRDKNKELESTI